MRLVRLLKTVLYFAMVVIGVFVIAALILRVAVGMSEASKVLPIEKAPAKRVAIVFGAGLQRNGNPSPELSERVATAADLYHAGKVEKLLMSGDNRFLNYNEPGAMRNYAVELGVPMQAIVLDYAGRRTYDTCYRASHIFGIRDAILVTQQYHLPRAIYTCVELGVDAVGVSASRRNSPYLYGNLREFAATVAALWEIKVAHPVPVLGYPEPIFPTGTPTGLQGGGS